MFISFSRSHNKHTLSIIYRSFTCSQCIHFMHGRKNYWILAVKWIKNSSVHKNGFKSLKLIICNDVKCNDQWFSITEFFKKTFTGENVQTLECPFVKKDLMKCSKCHQINLVYSMYQYMSCIIIIILIILDKLKLYLQTN